MCISAAVGSSPGDYCGRVGVDPSDRQLRPDQTQRLRIRTGTIAWSTCFSEYFTSRPLDGALQPEFQDHDRVEASFLFILNIGHVKEVAACYDSRGDAFEQWIPAFENLESVDGAKIAGQVEADDSWRHEAVLNCD